MICDTGHAVQLPLISESHRRESHKQYPYTYKNKPFLSVRFIIVYMQLHI
jgi:hypothetical protein